MKPKKVPMRQCVGCMEMKPKSELIRVVKNSAGEVFIDITGKTNGRGAYLCKNTKCLERAIKAKKFERTFETPVSDILSESLKKELKSIEQ